MSLYEYVSGARAHARIADLSIQTLVLHTDGDHLNGSKKLNQKLFRDIFWPQL